MIKGRCPICRKPYAVAILSDLPSFPFCSDRCKLVDLGRWIDGAYAIPGPESDRLPEANAAGEEEE